MSGFWDKHIKNSIYNPFRAVDQYKENSKYKLNLWYRFKAIFYVFSGRLDEPKNEASKGYNQIGLLDLFTGGLFYFVENLFRGNFLQTGLAQMIVKITFCIIPIVPALSAIRFAFALIPTLLISPIIIGSYYWDKHKMDKKVIKLLKENPTEIREAKFNLFNENYQQLEQLMNNPGNSKSGEKYKVAKNCHTIAMATVAPFIKSHASLFHTYQRDKNGQKPSAATFFKQVKDLKEGGYSLKKIEEILKPSSSVG
ncbi:MAG: hypothetical protein H0U73_09590 [Tatlockia sp.]|nr:hypothetical protein [Tatlockia sp.]